MSSNTKVDKHGVFVRLPEPLHSSLFEQAIDETRARKLRISVPALVVEKLDWLQKFQETCPDLYTAAKAALENKSNS